MKVALMEKNSPSSLEASESSTNNIHTTSTVKQNLKKSLVPDNDGRSSNGK